MFAKLGEDPSLSPGTPERQDAPLSAGSSPHSRRRKRRSDWREGGRSVRRWDAQVLVGALVGMGLGILSAATISAAGTYESGVISAIALWTGMSGAVAFAFSRGRPAGLLRLRAIDFLWGLGIGLCLRVIQGALTESSARAFPSAATLDGSLSYNWWINTALSSVVVAPLVEEFFFRALVLIGVYQLLRRSVGFRAAGLTAVLASAGAFILLHSAFSSSTLAESIQLFAVAAAGGALVLLTGRIWGAVLVHVCYNVSYVALVIVGVILR